MAERSEAETLDLVQRITQIIGHADEFGEGDLTTDINLLETEFAVGDAVPENAALTARVGRIVRAYGTFWRECQELARDSYPALGRLAGSPDLSNNNTNLDYFQQYAVTNSKEIEKRGFTKDTASTVTGSGAGKMTLASTDVNGDIIDVGHVETMTFRCIKDFSEGAAAGREQFQARGAALGDYPWQEGGSDLGASYTYPYGQVSADFGSGQVRGITGGVITSNSGASASGNLVRNGDFENSISGSLTTKVPQWDITTGDCGVAQETTDPILGINSLAITTDFVMDQNFGQNRLLPRAFYAISIKADRLASATGTLTVKVMDRDEGTTHGTMTQVIGSLTNDTPVVVQPVIFQVPENAEDLKVQVELASLATGTITIDDVVVAPAALIDGYLVAIHDGSTQDTSQNVLGRYKNGDEFDVVTTSTDAGLIQKFYFNMPSSRYQRSDTAATAGWEDPTL